MEARSLDFHRKVRAMFLRVHEYYPRPVMTIDGRADEHAVHLRVLAELVRVAW